MIPNSLRCNKKILNAPGRNYSFMGMSRKPVSDFHNLKFDYTAAIVVFHSGELFVFYCTPKPY